jgi:hypothetical protein
MKRLLIALVLLNVVLFGYARLVGEPGPALPAAEPPPIARLALLSELKAPPGPSCLSLGPFAEHGLATQAGSWLRGTHHVSRERSAEADGSPTYWVALTTSTLQQAARIAMRLKAANVSDVEVTPPGANQTDATVSFGIFSERDRAERRLTELRKLGVNAAIREQQHKVTQWWLDVPQRAGDPPLDVGALHKAVPGATAAALGPCPATATPAAPPAASPPAPPAAADPSSPGPAPAKLPGAPA